MLISQRWQESAKPPWCFHGSRAPIKHRGNTKVLFSVWRGTLPEATPGLCISSQSSCSCSRQFHGATRCGRSSRRGEFSSIYSNFYQFKLQRLHKCICQSIRLFIYLSIYLSVHPSVCLSVCLFYPSIHLYISVCLSVSLCIYLSVCCSIYLAIYICVYISVHLSIFLSVYLSVYLSIFQEYVETCLFT